MSDELVWEFECTCGEEFEIPASDTEFSPSSLVAPECPECGARAHHVGPVLDVCDRCGQDLLYHGNSGLGRDTLCESCYERLEVMM